MTYFGATSGLVHLADQEDGYTESKLSFPQNCSWWNTIEMKWTVFHVEQFKKCEWLSFANVGDWSSTRPDRTKLGNGCRLREMHCLQNFYDDCHELIILADIV